MQHLASVQAIAKLVNFDRYTVTVQGLNCQRKRKAAFYFIIVVIEKHIGHRNITAYHCCDQTSYEFKENKEQHN